MNIKIEKAMSPGIGRQTYHILNADIPDGGNSLGWFTLEQIPHALPNDPSAWIVTECQSNCTGAMHIQAYSRNPNELREYVEKKLQMHYSKH